MQLREHTLKPIPFPGDERGHLPSNSGEPGSLAGFFVPGVQVYQCEHCEELFQPVDESRYAAPEDPETSSHIRVPWGSAPRALALSHPMWACEPEAKE